MSCHDRLPFGRCCTPELFPKIPPTAKPYKQNMTSTTVAPHPLQCVCIARVSLVSSGKRCANGKSGSNLNLRLKELHRLAVGTFRPARYCYHEELQNLNVWAFWERAVGQSACVVR